MLVKERIRMKQSMAKTEANILNQHTENKLPNESELVWQVTCFKRMLHRELIDYSNLKVNEERENDKTIQ